MENMLDKEYFHFGNNKIRLELWLNLYMQKKYNNYAKPLGGLWCSMQNDYILCDWLLYIEEMSQYGYIYSYEDYVYDKNSSLIKFKNNSKILSINDKNDFKNLKDSGLTLKLDEPMRISNEVNFIYFQELPDYEKLKKMYDLLYVNPYADDSLNQYSINTMLVINPDAIEYYKPLKCDYYNRKIIDIGKKQTISNLSSEYIQLLKYIKNLIIIKTKQFDKDLYELKKELITHLMSNKNITNLIPNDIDKKQALGVAIINMYNEIQDEKKLILHN